MQRVPRCVLGAANHDFFFLNYNGSPYCFQGEYIRPITIKSKKKTATMKVVKQKVNNLDEKAIRT